MNTNQSAQANEAARNAVIHAADCNAAGVVADTDTITRLGPEAVCAAVYAWSRLIGVVFGDLPDLGGAPVGADVKQLAVLAGNGDFAAVAAIVERVSPDPEALHVLLVDTAALAGAAVTAAGLPPEKLRGLFPVINSSTGPR